MQEYRDFARTMGEREKEMAGDLDYRKKSGLLHDVHNTVNKARTEREMRERLLYEGTDIDRVGPAETHDIEVDPRKEVPQDAPKKGGKPDKGTRVEPEEAPVDRIAQPEKAE